MSKLCTVTFKDFGDKGFFVCRVILLQICHAAFLSLETKRNVQDFLGVTHCKNLLISISSSDSTSAWVTLFTNV